MSHEAPKPCIALMGEFSAGKSTLANLLIGESPLPVRIIATQLPPVKISHGAGDPYLVDVDGNVEDIDLAALDRVDLDRIAYLQIFAAAEFLEHCDLLDMPGISDPNMASEVWERMIEHADAVLWCSHAVQAWRQSEAAVWDMLSDRLRATSILLLTQIDKINSQNDRNRIVRRVSQETQGLFREVLPISLLTATQEQDDYDRWSQSGAEALVGSLVALLNDLTQSVADKPAVIPALQAPDRPEPEAAPDQPRVLPRRVRGAGNALRH